MTQRDWLSRERIETIKAVGFDRPFGRDSFMPSELDALCSMALAYLDTQEWRPIETAPKDGTPFRLLEARNAVWDKDGPRTFKGATLVGWRPLPQQKERPE